MKKFLNLLNLLLFSSFLFGQTPTFEWANSIGSTGNERGHSIAVDNSGNVYTTGVYGGTEDFDPGVEVFDLASNGSFDIFIQKLTESGDLVWAKSIGGSQLDMGNSIIVDDVDGSIYVTGYYRETVDFDPGEDVFNLVSNGVTDIFILKLDLDGNFIWAKSIGGTSSDEGSELILDDLGNIYLTGNFRYTVDFDPNIGISERTSFGSDDVFILKMNPSGDLIWAKSYGGVTFDKGLCLTRDDENNVYVGGIFRDEVDFDPSDDIYNVTAVGVGDDIFIQKLDSDGNFIWAKTIGGEGSERCNAITTNGSGNIYFTGNFESTVDFDPGVGLFEITSDDGSYDIYIVKLDLSGDFVWAKTIGDSGFESGHQIKVDVVGDIYVTGNFQNTVDFDPNVGVDNLTSNGAGDIFVQKLDEDGAYIWAHSFGGSNNDLGRGINVASGLNIYLTGGYQGTTDFDIGDGIFEQTSGGDVDIFISKISQCTEILTVDTIVACDSYIWLNDVEYTTNTTGPEVVYTSEIGCDSVVSLHLTILESSSSVDSYMSCDSLIWTNGVTYYDDNYTATDTFTNVLGCDSIITLDLTIIYPSAGIDTQTICDSFSWIDGEMYTEDNTTATHILVNAMGCDSVVTLNLTILESSYSTDSYTACDSFAWTDGITYYEDNYSATDSYTNILGCDSVVTLNLIVNYATEGIDTQVACDSFSWIDGETYTEDNITALHTLSNEVGCDSVVTLNLTITNSTSGTDTRSACNSFIWIDGLEYFEDNATATYTLLSEAGCDSMLTLDLTIHEIDIAVINDDPILTAAETDAEYQWLDCLNDYAPILGANSIDFTPEENGEYAVEIMKYDCIDTSICYAITTVGINEENTEDVQLFPNPTAGKVYFSCGNFEPIDVRVYTVQGKLVYSNTFSENSGIISLEIEGPAGVYFIELLSPKNSVLRKTVVKQ